MKLVLIQGNRYAQYTNRKQTMVVEVDDWVDVDPKKWVEEFRVNPQKAVA
jgi:hypothetical protein